MKRGVVIALLLVLALPLAAQDERRAALERDLRARPADAAGQLALAQLFEQEGFRVPALLAYLRFLSLEQDGKRAHSVAAHVRELLTAGVKQSKGNVEITVDPNSRKEEGDYSTAEMMLAIAAASSALPENRKKSEFEKVQTQVTLAVTMFTEAPAGDDFTAQVNLPFFAELGKRELTDAYVAIAFSSLGLKGTDVWMSHHPADVAKARELLRSQTAAPPIIVPR